MLPVRPARLFRPVQSFRRLTVGCCQRGRIVGDDADSLCASTEEPEKAVNGSTTGGNSDKWCSGGGTKFLRIDLGGTHAIQAVTVYHAGAGGEDRAWNTRDFDVQVSADGSTWTTAAQVRGNTADVSNHPVTATGRYLRLNILTPTQTTDPAARLYEVEVYGT